MEWLGPEAIYRQLAGVIARRIEDGTYQPGHPIPSTAALCDEFDVSAKTVRAAIRVLAEQGLVVGAVGRGVYVLDRAQDDENPAG